MSGQNPYLDLEAPEKPKKKYKITFMPMNVTIEVDPEKIPYDDHGQEGSILEIAMGHKINIDHSCGGVCACSTCHVIVKQGLNTCNDPSDAELDQVENAPKSGLSSRLACQCVPSGATDVVVEIPSWNRNAAKEGGH
jgi:ferredoxin, 2Fe-2S